MTMSTSTPRRSSSGSTEAQLPTSPTESGLAGAPRPRTPLDGVVEVDGQLVQVAVLDPALEPPPGDVDDQAHPAVERHGQRLRPAHPAAARR